MDKCVRCSKNLNSSNWFLSFQKKNLRKCKNCSEPSNLLEKRKQSYAKYRNLVFDKLGNACACEKCNVTDPEILSIDHIYGGGIQEKKIRRGLEYLKYLNKLSTEELKNNYQLLCYNCNYSKGFFKICGHLFKM
jgi:hypothetical protein